MSQKDLLKQQILDLTREYYKEVHRGPPAPSNPVRVLSTTAAVILMTANW